jgi:phage repressor protein C with HTH and peptisase S24 domain
VLGNSAYPRFKEGQTVWINPHAPFVKGDDVVVQVKTDDEEYPSESYIKEYVSRGGGRLHLWQHNPGPGEKHEIDFDLRQVYSIHKVVFAAMT